MQLTQSSFTEWIKLVGCFKVSEVWAEFGITEPVDFALAFWMVHEVSERPGRGA